MNKYYIQKIGGDIIYLDAKDSQKIKKDIESKRDIWYKGKYIPHHQIVDFGEIKSKEVNLLSWRDIFQLESGEVVQAIPFWALIVQMNIQRKIEGKKWIYSTIIEQVKKLSGLNEPKDVFEFIDSDGDELDWSLNKVDLKNETQRKGGCGQCEKGWLFTARGAYPCKCNTVGQEALREYVGS